jgi:hypothetical protein
LLSISAFLHIKNSLFKKLFCSRICKKTYLKNYSAAGYVKKQGLIGSNVVDQNLFVLDPDPNST